MMHTNNIYRYKTNYKIKKLNSYEIQPNSVHKISEIMDLEVAKTKN